MLPPGAVLDEGVRRAIVQRLTEVLPGVELRRTSPSGVRLDDVRFPLRQT